MKIKVTLEQSQACRILYPDQPQTRVLGNFNKIQLTYESVYDAYTGTFIASLYKHISGFKLWEPHDAHEYYSDIILTPISD